MRLVRILGRHFFLYRLRIGRLSSVPALRRVRAGKLFVRTT
jgi:hypothetical protein